MLAAITTSTKIMSRFKVAPPPREQVTFRPIFRSPGLRDRRFRLKDSLILWGATTRPEISATKSLPEILAEFERHANYREHLSEEIQGRPGYNRRILFPSRCPST